MSDPFRTHDHADRTKVVSAVRRYVASEDAHPAIVAHVETSFSGPMTRYEQTHADKEAAKKAEEATGEALVAADDEYDTAFREWAPTVRTSRGTSASAELAPLLGGHLPGEVPSLPYREEVAVGKGLLQRLRENSALAGKAPELARLKAAIAALEAAVDADEDAERRREAAVTVHARARKEFDQGYGKLRRIARAMLPEEHLERLIVRFARGGGGSGTPGSGT